jgi:hypothetical protein
LVFTQVVTFGTGSSSPSRAPASLRNPVQNSLRQGRLETSRRNSSAVVEQGEPDYPLAEAVSAGLARIYGQPEFCNRRILIDTDKVGLL